MLLKGCIIKDYVYKNAFSKYGRYTPIPMLFTCGIVLIPLIWKAHHPDQQGEQIDWAKSMRNLFVAAVILTVFALGGFIFTYAAMGPCESALAFVFKKGYLSWTIAYLIWYFVDCIFEANFYHVAYRSADYEAKKIKSDLAFTNMEQPELHINRRKKAGYACMVLYGVLIAAMSFGFRDIIMCFCGLFFLMGQMVVSAKAGKDNWRKGNIATSAVMFCVLAIWIGVIIVFFKKKVMI